VLDALRLIHAQAKKEPLQVDDVLRSVAISRRGLYDRFARTLGRSVHEEIKRVRVDEFARLLVSTGLPISQIASRLGCSDIKNLARYFKQAKGMSPLTYRKHHCLK
jgi:LacI family transcriptional regulator